MKLRILLIEDNPTSRKVVTTALSSDDFVVLEADDGKSALALLEEHGADLVLQDLALPGEDGFDLVRAIRQKHSARDIPILALSGFLSDLDVARVAASGFTDVIMKPTAGSRLREIIRSHLPSQAQPELQFGEGKRLILADDDEVRRRSLQRHLEHLGFHVATASDDVAALALAREAPPDAFLADIMIPNSDGFGLCMAVRRDAQLWPVPVILTTNVYADDADRELAVRSGATALIVRTPDLREVDAALRATLSAAPPVTVQAVEVLSTEMERERNRRVVRQLERQVAMNASLGKRSALQAAELSVMNGVCLALAGNEDIDLALDEVLSLCLDASGISMGILFLQGADLRISARSYGAPAELAGKLDNFFGHPQILRDIVTAGATVFLPSAGLPEVILQELSAAARIKSGLIIPVVSHQQSFGALLMASREKDITTEEWPTFAVTVGNQIGQALALARSFAERTTSERKANAQSTILSSVLETISDGVVVADESGKILFCNQAAASIVPLCATDALPAAWAKQGGMFHSDRLTPLAMDDLPLMRAVRGEVVESVEVFARAPAASDGAWLNVSARPLKGKGKGKAETQGGLLVLRDVTEEKATKEQLFVADRMASVGLMAAGVAHEINNPLAVIMANLDVASLELATLRSHVGAAHIGELADEITDAREAAGRVRDIVKDLKMFSRSESAALVPVDVQRVLESALRMAWNEIRHRACLIKEYGKVPLVHANESRLGQVFLNLIVNAAQAIPEGHQATNQIRIKTYVDAAGSTVVAITDSGPGIPPEVLKRLFTPFFTTKPVGVGTGLGLSICQRLVSECGGTLTVETKVGEGTTFRVTLLPPPAAVATVASVSAERHTTPARVGRILIIDDEPAIGTSLRRTFSPPHEVIAVMRAQDALTRIGAGERFDVILSDLMMPDMTGMDLHRELVRTAPDQAQRVIFITGGAFTPWAAAFLESVPNRRVEKPFDIENLRTLIASVLPV